MAESQTSTRVCATPGCSCRLRLRDGGAEASLDASSCLLHAQRASGAKGSGGWRDGVCGLCQPAAGLRITFAPPTSRPSSAAGSSAAGGRYGELNRSLRLSSASLRTTDYLVREPRARPGPVAALLAAEPVRPRGPRNAQQISAGAAVRASADRMRQAERGMRSRRPQSVNPRPALADARSSYRWTTVQRVSSVQQSQC